MKGIGKRLPRWPWVGYLGGMKYLTALLVLASCASIPVVAQERPSRSLETSLYGSWSYRDDFGGLGAAPGVGATFGYLVGPHSQLGVTLVRFSPWLASKESKNQYQFSYGLEYKHFWQPSWGAFDPFTPWVSYSLLLDQTVRQGVEGRGLAHHTRLGLGTDWAFSGGAGSDRQRLFVEAGWSMASYASFGVAQAPAMAAFHLGVGWRVLW